jgi:ketosteroid isomerase-like protein
LSFALRDEGKVLLDIAEKFFAAIESGDPDAIRTCYAPDARIWHNFDGIEQTVDENLKVLVWMKPRLLNKRYDVQRREALPSGFMQQHILRGELIDGSPFEMPACVICQVSDGLITRLEEYLDTAQSSLLRQQTVSK